MADALTKVVFALGVEAKGILNRHSARAFVLGDDRAVEIGG